MLFAAPTMFVSRSGLSAAGLPKVLTRSAAFTSPQSIAVFRLASWEASPGKTWTAPSLPPKGESELPPERRAVDSITATDASIPAWPVPNIVPSCPVLTRPVQSLDWRTTDGAAERLMSAAGAMELPPEVDASVPMSVRSWPFAPAIQMPYIGLWGLLCVSGCETAAIAAPFVPACAAVEAFDLMPRRIAPSECQASPSEVSMKLLPGAPGLGELGSMSPGRPSLS